jgi:hypothetical protein
LGRDLLLERIAFFDFLITEQNTRVVHRCSSLVSPSMRRSE